jgi:hypothetical protein
MITCVCERELLTKTYGPINVKGERRIRYNYKLYQLFDEPDIINVIKGRRLGWLRHLFRIEDNIPVEK